MQNRTEFLGDYGKQKPCAADPGQDAQGNAHGTQAEPLKADRASQLLLCGPYGGQQPKLLHALAEGDLKGVIDQEKRPHHDNGQQAAADRDQEGLKYRALRCPQKAQHGLIVQSLAAVPGVGGVVLRLAGVIQGDEQTEGGSLPWGAAVVSRVYPGASWGSRVGRSQVPTTV